MGLGFRVFAVLAASITITACAAFDSSQGENFEGFAPDEVPTNVAGTQGEYAGFYTGTATLDSNTCALLAEEAGAETPFSADVTHQNNIVNFILEDKSSAASTLEGSKTTFFIETASEREIYYVTFDEGAINGSEEVFEPNADGQFVEPCASYTIALKKGEKPAEEAKAVKK